LSEHDVVHRDLKMDNIMVSSVEDKFSLKIGDFGLSTIVENDDLTTTQLGTPLYMAPEVFSGSYDKKCDVWSLGLIIFEIIFGYSPFNRFKKTFELANYLC
jgi:serine/threonine protein kinase